MQLILHKKQKFDKFSNLIVLRNIIVILNPVQCKKKSKSKNCWYLCSYIDQIF